MTTRKLKTPAKRFYMHLGQRKQARHEARFFIKEAEEIAPRENYSWKDYQGVAEALAAVWNLGFAQADPIGLVSAYEVKLHAGSWKETALLLCALFWEDEEEEAREEDQDRVQYSTDWLRYCYGPTHRPTALEPEHPSSWRGTVVSSEHINTVEVCQVQWDHREKGDTQRILRSNLSQASPANRTRS